MEAQWGMELWCGKTFFFPVAQKETRMAPVCGAHVKAIGSKSLVLEVVFNLGVY